MSRRGFFFVCCAVLLLIPVASCHYGDENTGKSQLKIAIFKIVSHPAIDKMEEKFREYLERDERLVGSVKFDTYNAEGATANVNSMAALITEGDYDLAFVLGTPCALALKERNTKIPIVLGGATDPVGTGLVSSLDKPGGNVTGTTDLPPFSKHLSVLREMLPSARRIGVIYNQAEPNSRLAVSALEGAARGTEYQIRKMPISSAADIGLTIAAGGGLIDVLCFPTDNLIQANFPAAIAASNSNQIPAFNCDRDSVVNGAIFSVAVDYGDLGILSGSMAKEILLDKKSPANMPIRSLENPQLYINANALGQFGLDVPASLSSRAEVIN